MISNSFSLFGRLRHVGHTVAMLVTLAFCLGVTSTVEVLGQERRTIGNIEFVGLKRLNTNEVIASSGLVIGQAFDLKALDAATQKLADSGLFESIGYRTQTSGNKVTITFMVEESKAGNYPVIFDNFVWFTDAELMEAVRREVPSFNGTAPNAGQMIDLITAALQTFLKEHKIKGSVEYFPSQDDLGAAAIVHAFSVSGNVLRVCNINFPGANNISEAKLLKASAGLISTEYSRKFSSSFAIANLGPMYRELGQLRATFGQPLAKVSSESKCQGGVDLTIPVDEGAIYAWEKAEWSDNKVLGAADLDKELAMKSGEVANGSKIDKGLAAVSRAYGRKGYVERRLTSQPEFDEQARRVTFRISVKEGLQYKMGALTFKGFSESEEKRFRDKWKLMAGAPFDEDYSDEFIKHSLGGVLGQRAGGEQIRTILRPNKNSLTVDVSFEIVK